MKKVFLTSSLGSVADDLSKHLDSDVKKFLFVTTASELEKGDKWWLKADRESMAKLGYDQEDYTLTGKSKEEVEKKLKEVDGIIVAGGNTFHLLKQIQKSNTAKSIIDFVENGGVYIGSSAGSMVAGPDIWISREQKELDKVGELKDYKGLGLTDIIIQPHWGSGSFKKSYLDEIMENSYVPEYKQILLSDSQYVIIEDKNIRIVNVK